MTGESPATPLVAALADSLADAGVIYCHWKSNESIHEAVSGAGDLDLLFAREHAPRAAEILRRHGFVLARPTRDRQLPGILDYYARDDEAGLIIHVHAHFQLVLGDDMTKNFHLPVERPYLRSRTLDGPLPIPSAEWEYLVFVLRMVVKHSTWDAQLARKGKLAQSERRELADLTARIDRRTVEVLRRENLPMIDAELFLACEEATRSAVSRAQRVLVARRLLRAIDSLGRSGRVADTTLRVWRRTLRRVRGWGSWHASGKRPDVGGSIIAVVGSDGSGKSSAVQALVNELSKDFAVRPIHMGKPQWSLVTKLVRKQMQRARRLGLFKSITLVPWTDFTERPFPGYGYLFWHLMIARDRYRQYRRARRASGRGELVVSDRWPLSALSMMDGPRLQGIPKAASSRFVKRLCDLELQYYRRILPPDLVIVLRVSPHVAIQRRTDDPPDFVHRRASEVWNVDWEQVGAVVIDADQAIEVVHDAARHAAWALL